MKIFVSCTPSSRNLRFLFGVLLCTWSLSFVAPRTSAEDLSAAQQIERDMEGLYLLSEVALREAPRHEYDPSARQKLLGQDPLDLLRWVREDTRLIPYEGVLRSASGVMQDRMGNSLDRSLLLYELLGSAGWENRRLARATLSEDNLRKANQLIVELPPQFPTGEPSDAEAEDQALEMAARILQRSPDDLLYFMEEFRFEALREAEDLLASILHQEEELQNLLRGGSGSESRSTAPALGATHWWVEYENEEGQWIALDPFPGQEDSGAVAFDLEAEETLRRSELAEEKFHRVDVTLVAERWEEGKLLTEEVFRRTLRAGSLPEQYFEIAISPRSLDEWSISDSGEDTIAFAMEQKEWLPVLDTGDELVLEASILIDGTLNENPTEAPTARSFREASSVLGGIGVGGRSEETKSSFLTAVYLDYKVYGPGVEPETERRYFFDLVGSDKRLGNDLENFSLSEEQEVERALGLMAKKSVYVQGYWKNSDWVARQMFRQMVRSRNALSEMMQAAEQNETGLFQTVMGRLPDFPLELYAVGSDRWQHHPQGLVTTPRGLNLLAHQQSLAPSGKDGRVVVRDLVDLIRSSVSPLPGIDSPGNAVFLQGIVDTHVEHFTRRNAPSGAAEFNVARQMQKDFLDEVEWIRIADSADLEQHQEAFSSDTLALWQKRLQEGKILLVRSVPVTGKTREVGLPLWWEWNPDTEDLLGFGDVGYGQSSVEYFFSVANTTYSIAGAILGAVDCSMSSKSDRELACCMLTHVITTGFGVGLGSLFSQLYQSSQFVLALSYDLTATHFDPCANW
ncbi:MAG: hypothetical protein JJT75_01670 [Opitutales bacterium]|nr:hypothetical protein [Opitutales bacterium]MCH8539488.1 hypothetical protein [Opitutales bacterium]